MSEAASQPIASSSLQTIAASLATEAGAARAAIFATALHVADDNFLQPEPGTSAGDHLAGGLVPLALLAAAGYAYPRLRPGARAITALAIGLLSITIGAASGLYATLATGASGDDYTGILALLGGIALVGIGAVTLWRSRRGGSLRRRIIRRSLLAAGGALVV